MTIITTPLELVEDAILARLAVYAAAVAWPDLDTPSPYAWGALPADTVRRMTALGDTDDGFIPYGLVAQHQNGGGAQDNRIGNGGWSGLVTVRSMAGSDAQARVGYSRALTAMAGLVSPTGYRLTSRFDRPIDIPYDSRSQVYTRAAQWEIRLRRTA